MKIPRSKPDPIYDAWEQFHEDNPHIYDELVAETRDYIEATGQPPSINMVTEFVRRMHHVRTRSADGYKISNNHRAIYAREIMRREPDLADAFKTKTRSCER